LSKKTIERKRIKIKKINGNFKIGEKSYLHPPTFQIININLKHYFSYL
jgi:hypothetical protein